MNKYKKIPLFYVLVLFLLSMPLIVLGQKEAALENNRSPYFVILSEDDAAQLPLKSTEVSVDISGVIAGVNVKQVYANTGKSTIEAVYVFPASNRAAVYEMVMKVNDRQIRAVVKEKSQARRMYEEAKQQGKTTSLLEEERPNVFKMNVGNIVPGSTVEVSLSYTELLVPEDKTYEFVYPTVVGPRYLSKGERVNNAVESWAANPYLQGGEEPVSSFTLNLNINAGIPIKEMRCETHKHLINFKDMASANLILLEKNGGNRDVIVQYRLAGDSIQSGLLLYDDPKGEKYFLAMIQPPQKVNPQNIPNREYVFIVDVSGSMSGFPLDVSKELMKELLNGLDEKDLFNIVFFAGGSELYSNASVPATVKNITDAMNYMDNIYGSGGTELLQALKKAMTLNKEEDYSRSFVILTDGYVSVEKQTFDYIRENLGEANFFSFGIGSSVNRFLIEGMAHVGCAESFVAVNRKEAVKQAEKFTRYVAYPVLTNISYEFENVNAYEVLPESVPDVFANRPIIISGKYHGNIGGEITIKGLSGDKEYVEHIAFDGNYPDEKSVKYLWAREKIRLLADYKEAGFDDAMKKEVVRLGEKYNLLTEYTSFIAIDDSIVNNGGEQHTVNQPSPLPKGLSNMSVCAEAGELYFVDDMKVASKAATMSGGAGLEIVEEEGLVEDIELVEDLDQLEIEGLAVFTVVEQQPEYPGGSSAMYAYLKKNLLYPQAAIEKGISGKVFVQFVVEPDGAISNVRVLRGIGGGCDEEAIRVVKNMPKWKPGKQRGVAVRVQYNLPIVFALGK